MKKIYLFVSALLALAISSCIDDSYDLDNFSDDLYIPIEQVVPVGSSVVTVADLLKEMELEGLHESSDGLIYFQYDTVSSFYVNSLEFELEKDTTKLDLSEIFPVGLLLPDIELKQGISMEARLPIVFSDETGEGRIDSAEIRRASVDFKVVSNVPGLLDVLDLKVTMPENIKSAQSVSPLFWNKRKSEGSLILENVWLDLSKSDTLVFDCQFILDGQLPLSKIKEDSYIEIVCSANELSYKRLYGFFVAHTTQVDSSSMGIDIYEEEDVDYSLSLADPRLEIRAWTNSGVPINVGVESLVARNNSGKKEVAKFANGASRYTLTLNPSTKEGEEVLGMNVVFDGKNGSIDKLINSAPDTVDVATSFFVNGDEGSAEKSYFLLDSTYVRLGISAMVPMWMNAGSFIGINDTIEDLDIYQDIVDYEKEDYEVEEATLYLEVENGLPLKTRVDFSFLKEDTIRTSSGLSYLSLVEITDEKFKQNVELDPAVLDEDTHMALKPVKNLVKIDVDKTMLDDIKKIKHIAVKYRVEVPVASSSVKVYSQNIIKAKAYVHVKGNYSSGDDK